MIKWIDSKTEKRTITEKLLRSLPNWFGIESAIIDYVNDSENLEMVAWIENKEVVGFLTPKKTSSKAVSIHLMAVSKAYHHQGIGKKLFQEALDKARKQGCKYYTVKTLDEKNTDVNYSKTRLFYERVGFEKLETFDTLWDASNPCMLMIYLIN
jgi:ribosomal protein S18 acetylase RimI-like enzyme